MRERLLARAGLGLCGVLMLAYILFGLQPGRRVVADEPKPVAAAAKDTFGMTKVWSIHLEIPAKEFDAMPPAFGGFGQPPKKEEKKDDKKRDSEKNLFGTDF